MTDKEKIRKEVEIVVNRRLNLLNGDHFDLNKEVDGFTNEIIDIIDSLQEELVGSIWHDASEEPNGDNSIVIAYDNGCTVEPSFKDFKSYSEWGTIKKSYRVKQWAYVNDVLNLTNKEEPVSEFLNTESMIESYKQKLISQPNGLGSYLTDICLASYKHGINETLDTLKLSNVQKTVKDWKEPVSEELEKEEFIDTEEIINEIDPEHKVCTITDLEEAAMEYFKQTLYNGNNSKMQAFKAGAEWQKEKEYTCYEEAFEDGAKWKVENLWKPADGDDLPEYEREVVVLTQPYPLENSEYAVYFAHRPNPDGWDGKSFVTGKTEHYTPKTYGKGGWNIPNVVLWLDAKLPKEIEL